MRTRRLLTLALAALLLAACGAAGEAATGDAPVLSVTDGAAIHTFTADDLMELPAAQASQKGVTYTGVALTTLLEAAGYDPDQVSVVKATALDGFSAEYDPDLIARADTLVAYARADGPLAADEAPFRMLLPAEGGKLNPRQVVELQVTR
jgi:hypothetical protein